MTTNKRLVSIHLIHMQFLQQSKLSSTDSPIQIFLNRYTISRQINYPKFPKMRSNTYSIPPSIPILAQFHVCNTNFNYLYRIDMIIILGQKSPLFIYQRKYQITHFDTTRLHFQTPCSFISFPPKTPLLHLTQTLGLLKLLPNTTIVTQLQNT